MAHSATVESRKLRRLNDLIASFVEPVENRALSRLSLLEAVSCRRSGIPVETYRAMTGYDASIDVTDGVVDDLVAAIDECGLPTAIALASLARIEEDEVSTKRNGAVYTDFRLAKYLAHNVMSDYSGGAIIDPSCGTSIVLAACVNEYRGNENVEDFVAKNIYGIDLSPLAIRGSILVLAAYIREGSKLESLVSHFVCGDSLDLADGIPGRFGLRAFSAVVGNPPWERVRPSRNEFAREHGLEVNYGIEIGSLPPGYEQHRNASCVLSNKLSKAYNLKGGVDLYRAFLGLGMRICSEDGCVAFYLPAGLIRSKSLAPLRSSMAERFEKIDLSVFMNSAKYFAIDSRFKFVLAILVGEREDSDNKDIHFRYCTASDKEVIISSELEMGKDQFSDASGALGVPEVKTDSEANTLKRIRCNAKRMKDHELFGTARPIRELDMTLDRPLFRKSLQVDDSSGLMPLIEGRMVSQFRCGCKEYLGGAGRSARWGSVSIGRNRVVPQFYVAEADLSPALLKRVKRRRVGFCDIAGQTNERAMQATFIPAGCVCGNKVPTLLFDDDDVAMLWLGVVNSFVFDWVVRRYITNTINFFILENLPFPTIGANDEVARSIVGCVRRIYEMNGGDEAWGQDEIWAYAFERAKLEALVVEAYGLNECDMGVVLADFPLVDQMNSKLFGVKPTVDLVRAFVADGKDAIDAIDAIDAVKDARIRGAIPYVSNEYIRNLMR